MSYPPLLHPYQQRWIGDRARFKIGMFARQTGKTFAATLEIVEHCLIAHAQERATRWLILSRGERQAAETMELGVKRHARAYGVVLEELRYEVDGPTGRLTAHEVVLPGGSRVTALPSTPDTARGFSANVYLDELAVHPDGEAVWAALFPVVSAGWKLRVTSTPNGVGNVFHRLMTAEAGWSRHVVDIHRAVADGLPRHIPDLRRALGDEAAWRREYELDWGEAASAWLAMDLLAAAEHEGAGDPAGYAGGPCFVGNDIARRGDLWAAWVWEAVGDVLWTREVVTLARASFAEQEAALAGIVRRYRVAKLAMDQTGMGEKPVEDAVRRWGAARVEGVVMSGPRRLAVASAARAAFEERRVRIPAGDPELRADLHRLRRESGPTGAPRLVAPRDAAGHADRAWAAFLGLAAAAEAPPAPAFRSAGPRRPPAGLGDFLG